MNRYHINIFWSEEDGAFVADAPDLESCSGFGETPEEAPRELRRAMEAWLAAARDSNRPIPEPRYKPAIPQSS